MKTILVLLIPAALMLPAISSSDIEKSSFGDTSIADKRRGAEFAPDPGHHSRRRH
jgi:hypothetical protein